MIYRKIRRGGGTPPHLARVASVDTLAPRVLHTRTRMLRIRAHASHAQYRTRFACAAHAITCVRPARKGHPSPPAPPTQVASVCTLAPRVRTHAQANAPHSRTRYARAMPHMLRMCYAHCVRVTRSGGGGPPTPHPVARFARSARTTCLQVKQEPRRPLAFARGTRFRGAVKTH